MFKRRNCAETNTVNGQSHALSVDPRLTLPDLLRENFAPTGTKKGCDHGQCGTCTVLASGRHINSCLSLAVVHDGNDITTVEGLAKGNELHPMQAAFLEQDGFQCGYRTPGGQLCSAVGIAKAIFQAPGKRVRDLPITPDKLL
jgi:xanthine dehydrogenase YagT iron-sulfur-binding subunit